MVDHQAIFVWLLGCDGIGVVDETHFFHRSARGCITTLKKSTRASTGLLPFPLVRTLKSRQNPGLSTPTHQCQVSMPSPTASGSTPYRFAASSPCVFRYQA